MIERNRGAVAVTDWTQIAPTEHFVQFYEADAFLLDSLAGYIGAGIPQGHAAIVITTPEHRRGLESRLEAQGIDLTLATVRGQYAAFDAAETLSRFMVGDWPDSRLFVDTVGPIVARAIAAGSTVRAFGEMVALLAAQGNEAAAVRLEKLWNDLGKTYSFSLFCAYPLGQFEHSKDGAPFAEICRTHARVIPAESYSRLTDRDDRLRAVSILQQKALALEAEVGARRKAEDAARLRERELSDFLENAAEGLHRVGPDGTILWANRAELELLGYGRDEYIGHHVSEFHVDAAVIQDILDRQLRGETVYNTPARLRAKDGSIRHVLIHSNALWVDGRFVYTRCFTRDVTERQKLQDERDTLLSSERAARQEAERASRMKDEFVATLSHELRTPLTAILGWSQHLRTGSLEPEELGPALETIERNARAQARMIEELLDINRIAAGKLRLDVRRVDLTSVVREAAESIRLAADAKGIRLEISLDRRDCVVNGDPTRLQQIIWNLLSNAVKFTAEGGQVRAGLAHAGSHVEVTVQDNGKGIRAEFLPHLFERFRQEDGSITRHYGGLGLGLAIVKNLVEMHGGSVRAASDGEGTGSTFTVELPLFAIDFAAARPPSPAENETPSPATQMPVYGIDTASERLSGVKVLVVDDDHDARGIIARLFTNCDAVVASVGSVAEAKEMFLAFRPDILLSDIGMPDTDGYDLVRWVRALRADQGRHTPAAALTAFVRPEDQRRILLAGYQVHISKPIESSELITVAASLAELSRRPNGTTPPA